MSQDTPNMNSLLGQLGMPGMFTPTLDTGELEKKIKDLKAVEGWLSMNLSMLKMSIQGLEVQRNTLLSVKAVGEALKQSGQAEGVESPDGTDKPADWPWNLMSQFFQAPAAATEAPPTEATEPALKKPATKKPSRAKPATKAAAPAGSKTKSAPRKPAAAKTKPTAPTKK